MRVSLPRALGETEICDLDDAFGQEYVGNLEISVNYVLFRQVFESLEDFVDYFGAFAFRHGSFLPDPRFQVAIAQLRDDIAIVRTRENFVAAQDVRVVQSLYYFDLGIEQVHKGGRLNAAQFDHFDGHGLVYYASMSYLLVSSTLDTPC